jgi:hypothetical protein
MTMSHSSRAAKSRTSTVQTVLPMRDRQRFEGRQRRVAPQPVSAAGGIAAGDADPVVGAAAEAVDRSNRLRSADQSKKGLRPKRNPFVFVERLRCFDRALKCAARPRPRFSRAVNVGKDRIRFDRRLFPPSAKPSSVRSR